MRQSLTSAERRSGNQRQSTLSALAVELDRDANSSSDASKVRALAGAVRRLVAAR